MDGTYKRNKIIQSRMYCFSGNFCKNEYKLSQTNNRDFKNLIGYKK